MVIDFRPVGNMLFALYTDVLKIGKWANAVGEYGETDQKVIYQSTEYPCRVSFSLDVYEPDAPVSRDVKTVKIICPPDVPLSGGDFVRVTSEYRGLSLEGVVAEPTRFETHLEVNLDVKRPVGQAL